MKYKVLFFLAFISLISSIFLLFNPWCDEQNTCDLNEPSDFNYYLGIVVFSLMLFLLWFQIVKPTKNKKIIINISIIIWAMAGLYLLYLQHFVLQAYCKYCLTIDISGLVALMIILFWKGEKKNSQQKQIKQVSREDDYFSELKASSDNVDINDIKEDKK